MCSRKLVFLLVRSKGFELSRKRRTIMIENQQDEINVQPQLRKPSDDQRNEARAHYSPWCSVLVQQNIVQLFKQTKSSRWPLFIYNSLPNIYNYSINTTVLYFSRAKYWYLSSNIIKGKEGYKEKNELIDINNRQWSDRLLMGMCELYTSAGWGLYFFFL